jgi:ABC-type antimicrobial peptide transport system permease subunit
MILPLSLWVDSIAVFQLIALLPSTLCYGRKIGMARGVAVAYLILIYAKYHFTLSLISIVLGTSVALLTGLFFGIYPARQAAKLNPIMALHSE